MLQQSLWSPYEYRLQYNYWGILSKESLQVVYLTELLNSIVI